MTAVGHPDPTRLASPAHRADLRTAHPPPRPGTMITPPQKLIPRPRRRLALLTAPSVHNRISSPFAPANATTRRRSAGMSAQVSGHQCRKARRLMQAHGESARCERWFTGTWVHIEASRTRQQTGMTAPVVGSLADYLDAVYPADTGGTACHPGATAWRRLSYTPPLRPCRAKARTGGVAPPGVQPSPARSCPADISTSTAGCVEHVERCRAVCCSW